MDTPTRIELDWHRTDHRTIPGWYRLQGRLGDAVYAEIDVDAHGVGYKFRGLKGYDLDGPRYKGAESEEQAKSICHVMMTAHVRPS